MVRWLKNRKFTAFVLASALAAPLFVYAQLPPPPNGIPISKDTIKGISDNILSTIWIGAIVFIVIAFIVIGSYFLLTKGDPEKIKEARNALIWAVGGVVVMVLAWSIYEIVKIALRV